MTPRLRPCGIPECRICRWNDDTHHDSGHPVEEPEPLVLALVGTAALIILFIVAFVVMPVVLG